MQFFFFIIQYNVICSITYVCGQIIFHKLRLFECTVLRFMGRGVECVSRNVLCSYFYVAVCHIMLFILPRTGTMRMAI